MADEKWFNVRLTDDLREKLLIAIGNPFEIVEGEKFFCRFEADLKERVPLRSKLPRPEKRPGLRCITVNNDIIDEYNRDATNNLVGLILSALPGDVFLVDNPSRNAITFLVPAFNAIGSNGWYDSTSIVFGSQAWSGPEEGKMIPQLNLEFRKDPVTWAITCKIVEENDK